MKKLKCVFLAFLIGGMSLTQTGCIGSFGLFNNVLDWNKQVGGKFISAGLFLVLWIIPVYEIIITVDVIILNSIEFWTGSNPIAMKPGEKETEIVKGEDGKTYEITASQNRFNVIDLDEGTADFALVFDTEEKAWNYQDAEQDIKLIEFNEDETVTVFLPGGDEQVFAVKEPENLDKSGFQSMLFTEYAVK